MMRFIILSVLNTLMAYTFYLANLGFQTGGFELKNIVLTVIFALMGAFGSVFMEMKFPLTNYKTESDLWHHPRKYIAPVALLLIAGVVCMV